jgi:hypothetical protein
MAKENYVTIPKTVEDVIINGAPFSFHASARYVIEKDPRFNNTGEGIRAGIEILSDLKDAPNEGDVAVLRPEHRKLLSMCFEAPETPNKRICPGGFQQRFDGSLERVDPPGATFISYLDAVSDENTSKKPEPKKEPAPEPETVEVPTEAPAEAVPA